MEKRIFSFARLLMMIICLSILCTAPAGAAGHLTKYKGVSYSRVYNYIYYTTKVHPELKGKSDKTVLSYFVKKGMAKGEQAISTFDPKAYRRGSKKLRSRYGKRWKKYYMHYQTIGYRKKRYRKIAVDKNRGIEVGGGAPEYSKADQYASDTPYLILLNQTNHTVYVFKGSQGSWTKVKTFPCCTGKPSTPTPTGVFKSGDKGEYFYSGECRCWYYVRITDGILFHSQIYDGSSSPVRCVDGSMGVSCTHGSVRLNLSNAKWIYDNIPYRTKIVSYR